jgi:probable rRNA maturation factor
VILSPEVLILDAVQHPIPQISIHHRALATDYDRDRLEELALAALPLCLDVARSNNAELAELSEVEVSILGTRAMAKVHRDFLGIPGATDVITFPYGEILVCAPVAASRALEFGHTTTEELALYVIHGLLHLSGYDDTSEALEKKMAAAQQGILQRVLGR